MPSQTSDPRPAPGSSRHRLDHGERFRITDHDTSGTGPYGSEEEAAEALEEHLGRLHELSDRLGAEGEDAVLVVLQGFDGAGKDQVITNVLGAIDPALLHVFSFNKPVGDEAEH